MARNFGTGARTTQRPKIYADIRLDLALNIDERMVRAFIYKMTVLLLGIALGPEAEESMAAAREVADVLVGLCARVGIAVAADAAARPVPGEDEDGDEAATARAPARTSALVAPAVTLVPMDASLRQRAQAALPLFPDWPRPGIVFVDVLPLWRAPDLLRPVLAALAEAIPRAFGRLDFVAGLEARGFLFQSVALALSLPFVCVRKAGKLPGATVRLSYELEYGSAALEIARDAAGPGERGVIVDDLLATGGTCAAAAALLREIGAVPVGIACLVDIGIGGSTRAGLPALAVMRV